MPVDLIQIQLSADEQQLMTLVPEDGSTIGNKYLRTQLGWGEEKYWAVRDGLWTRGLLLLGRGKGGSVRRASSAVLPETGVVTPPPATGEEGLYDPAIQAINSGWAKEEGLENYIVEKTARQGRRETGGAWTRPDVTVIYVSNYRHIRRKVLDVVTFEIKDHPSLSVAAVHEALSHYKAATMSYVLVRVPADQRSRLDAAIETVASEARRHDIGLIVAAEIGDYSTWDFIVDANRHDPDPDELDGFVGTQIGKENRRKLDALL